MKYTAVATEAYIAIIYIVIAQPDLLLLIAIIQ